MYVDVLFKLKISIGTKLALKGNFHNHPKKISFNYVTAYVTNDWYLVLQFFFLCIFIINLNTIPIFFHIIIVIHLFKLTILTR